MKTFKQVLKYMIEFTIAYVINDLIYRESGSSYAWYIYYGLLFVIYIMVTVLVEKIISVIKM